MTGEIDPEAGDHGIALAFEQDAAELGAIRDQVVRPFDQESGRRRESGGGLVECDPGDEGQGGCGRVGAPQAYEGAGMEIALGRLPGAPLPPPSPRLASGPEP